MEFSVDLSKLSAYEVKEMLNELKSSHPEEVSLWKKDQEHDTKSLLTNLLQDREDTFIKWINELGIPMSTVVRIFKTLIGKIKRLDKPTKTLAINSLLDELPIEDTFKWVTNTDKLSAVDGTGQFREFLNTLHVNSSAELDDWMADNASDIIRNVDLTELASALNERLTGASIHVIREFFDELKFEDPNQGLSKAELGDLRADINSLFDKFQ